MRKLIVLLGLLLFVSHTHGLSCIPCYLRNCTIPICESSGYALGICGCCPVCARQVGYTCGGVWNTLGTCDKNLTCRYTEDSIANDWVFPEGTCVDTYCKAIIDLILVVDGSASIVAEKFEIFKEVAINITEEFYKKFGACAHIEVLQYSDQDALSSGIPIGESTKFEIPFTLGECTNNIKCVMERMGNMSYLNGDTYTYNALRRASEVEFDKSSRSGRAQKVIIVLTDGGTSDAMLLEHYQEYNDSILTFAVGVGSNDILSELRTIANGNTGDDRVLFYGNFNDLAIQPVGKTLVNITWPEVATEVHCPANEESKTCSSICNSTCNDPTPLCPAVCGPPMCECKSGYVRKSEVNSTCVQVQDCPTKECVHPEVLANCASVCPPTCDDRTPECIEICVINQCVCDDGYVRKSTMNNTCIKESECMNGSIPICDYPKQYVECPGACPATCSNPKSETCLGNDLCGNDHCVCPIDHVLYSETDRRCVHAYECPDNTCVKTCPKLNLNDCSSKIAEAWMCEFGNWKCDTYAWTLVVEEWWFSSGCYSIDGTFESKWRQLFSCHTNNGLECSNPTSANYYIDAFGCQWIWCSDGMYKDVNQLMKIWQQNQENFKAVNQLYIEAVNVCESNKEADGC